MQEISENLLKQKKLNRLNQVMRVNICLFGSINYSQKQLQQNDVGGMYILTIFVLEKELTPIIQGYLAKCAMMRQRMRGVMQA